MPVTRSVSCLPADSLGVSSATTTNALFYLFFSVSKSFFQKYMPLVSGNTTPLMDLSWSKHEAGPDRRHVSRPATPGRFHQTHESPRAPLTAAMFPPAVDTVDVATLISTSLRPHPPFPLPWRQLCDRPFLRSFAEG